MGHENSICRRNLAGDDARKCYGWRAAVTSWAGLVGFVGTGFGHPVQNGPATWDPALTSFEAINMAVIPLAEVVGPDGPLGKVIVWDKQSDTTHFGPGPWDQRFSVGAPEATPPYFDNYSIVIPAGLGDLFCAGHTWMPDGRLFVAGGTIKYPDDDPAGPQNYLGSAFAGIWDPTLVNAANNWGWTYVQPMALQRWYPTVTLLGDNTIMVSGGVVDTDNRHCETAIYGGTLDPAADTYEIWDIATGNWISGPVSPGVHEGPDYARQSTHCYSLFGEYPRQHLLSSGHLFVAGMYTGGNRVHPQSHGAWLPLVSILGNGMFRNYGSSVLLPNVGRRANQQDRVMILGGSSNTALNASPTVQVCNAFSGTGSTAWSSFPSMNVGRMVANAVLLPDGAVLVIGGSTNGSDYFNFGITPVPETRPEVYRRSTNQWVLQNPQVSARMYHSTAALLPSGKVVSAGGDVRSHDYEVFAPDYLPATGASTRPVFVPTSSGPFLDYDTTYSIQYAPMPIGMSVDRVVLMRPCSITHHSDMDQRYVELEELSATAPPDTIVIKTPPTPNPFGTTQGSIVAPPGFYLMFLISNTGVPSVAKWVHLQ